MNEKLTESNPSPSELLTADSHIIRIEHGLELDADSYGIVEGVDENISFDIENFVDVATRYLNDPVIIDDFTDYEARKAWKASLSEDVWQENNKNTLRLNRVRSIVNVLKQFATGGNVFRHLPEAAKQSLATLVVPETKGYGELSVEDKMNHVYNLQNCIKMTFNALIDSGLVMGEKF